MFAPAPLRPAQLPAFVPRGGSLDIDRDCTKVGTLPPAVQDFTIPITTTRGDEHGPYADWYLARSKDSSAAYRVDRPGIVTALDGARQLAASTGPVAVVQAASGERYLMPLGMWNPADESELDIAFLGGIHWTSAADHTLVGPAESEPGADVEAVVFRDGGGSTGWVNLTGHPVRFPR